MASNKLRVQRFRTNDLNNNGGKQFELGKGWCEEFFGIAPSLSEAIISLIFKPLCLEHASLLNKEIELKLAEITNRGDRKAYANGQHGLSQIKNLFIDDLHLTEEDNLSDYFAIYKASINQYYLYYIPQMLYDNFIKNFESITPDISIVRDSERTITNKNDLPLQQIFYGAPGTGKSNTIKREVDDKKLPNVRTTFHPDSDYSTFVGVYKPKSTVVPVTTIIGKEQVLVPNAQPEKKIVYEFVPQAFLKAYTSAWKNQNVPFFLIIEEINRGNCAQIFGDLFQLLDRDDKTKLSVYPISPDEDIIRFLQTDNKYGFASLSEEQKASIPIEVLSGELMILPKNLYIWATMNTSDQSLFPIDSAFKRRWDWQYMPIREGVDNKGNKLNWKIEANELWYDWWEFLNAINSQIEQATNSEDKKLGYFFCKAQNGIIDAKTFVSKVVFYLWNDVFKDFADETGDLFKDSDGTHLTFNKFYDVDSNGNPVMDSKVGQFLKNLKIEGVEQPDNVSNEEEFDDSDEKRS